MGGGEDWSVFVEVKCVVVFDLYYIMSIKQDFHYVKMKN